jgi:hypothetical protein
MAVTRRNMKRRRGFMSRKRGANSKKMRFMHYRGKGVYQRPPSFLPIPPPQPPSLPIPPPRPPSMPRPPASYLPIPPPPIPLFIEPSPSHFIIKSQSPKQLVQKKSKVKQPKPESKSEEAKLVEEPGIAKQRRSLRQMIIKSDHNTKIKRR